jgi:hypothetical protein
LLLWQVFVSHDRPAELSLSSFFHFLTSSVWLNSNVHEIRLSFPPFNQTLEAPLSPTSSSSISPVTIECFQRNFSGTQLHLHRSVGASSSPPLMMVHSGVHQAEKPGGSLLGEPW